MSCISLNTVNNNASVQLQVRAKKINWNHNTVIAIESAVTSAHRYFPRTDYLPPWVPTKLLELISVIMTFTPVKSADKMTLFYFKISSLSFTTSNKVTLKLKIPLRRACVY